MKHTNPGGITEAYATQHLTLPSMLTLDLSMSLLLEWLVSLLQM